MKRKFRPSIWLCFVVGISVTLLAVRGWPVYKSLTNLYEAHVYLTFAFHGVEDHYEQYHGLPSSDVVKTWLSDHTNALTEKATCSRSPGSRMVTPLLRK